MIVIYFCLLYKHAYRSLYDIEFKK